MDGEEPPFQSIMWVEPGEGNALTDWTVDAVPMYRNDCTCCAVDTGLTCSSPYQ